MPNKTLKPSTEQNPSFKIYEKLVGIGVILFLKSDNRLDDTTLREREMLFENHTINCDRI